MKYVLASLIVGLIGGSQVVASGQESEVEETTGLADHKALDWIVAQARGAKGIGPGDSRYVPRQGANSKGKKLERESAKQPRQQCNYYETSAARGACYAARSEAGAKARRKAE